VEQVEIIPKINDTDDRTPEYALYFAIIHQGVKDILDRNKFADSECIQALFWFFSNNNRYVNDFLKCCEIVDVSPDSIRTNIMRHLKKFENKKCHCEFETKTYFDEDLKKYRPRRSLKNRCKPCIFRRYLSNQKFQKYVK
jgi:hypothetical protein